MELKVLDYSDKNNWIKRNDNPSHKVDQIFIYPTVVNVSDSSSGINQISPQHRRTADLIYKMFGSAFEEYTNVYAPYYHQISLEKALTLISKADSLDPYIEYLRNNIPKQDIFAFFDYYFKNINNGRPFILVSHSQGSCLMSIVLEEYFRKYPQYLKNMIACYALGFPFDNEWLSKNPYLKFAQSEIDTGVIVSWNTEGPNATLHNCLIKPNGYNINPLNWKTDETPAKASLNKGSIIRDLSKIQKGVIDATINKKRGSLICTTCDRYIEQPFWPIFGDKSLHMYDGPFFYENLKENGLKRIQNYLKNIDKK